MAPEPFATIVSGLPRSGTSMMMMMLEAGGLPVLTDHLRSADQENPRGYYEYEPVKKTRSDSSWVKDAGGTVVKVVHLLLYDMPAAHSYRVVLMRRNMDEVLASQKQMLERQGQKGANMPPDRLAKIFSDQMAKLVKWLADQPNFQVLEVNYNQVLEDPQKQAAAINSFLAGELDADAMAAVVDNSLYRQRK